MKQIALLLTLSLLMAASPPATTPFNQYGNICFEDEQARLDNFAFNLQNQEDAVGYIIVYSGKTSCRDEAKYRGERARKWVVKRGVKADRIFVRDAGYQEEIQTFLWVVAKGLTIPESNSGLDKKDVSIHKCVDKVFARVLCPNR